MVGERIKKSFIGATVLFVIGLFVWMMFFVQAQPVRDCDAMDSHTGIRPRMENSRYDSIVFAGGCFWGVQAWFDRMMGVVYTEAAYANGSKADTEYSRLKDTGHAEAVLVVFDAERLDLMTLLERYFMIIDPTSLHRQGSDFGIQYRTGIYYMNDDHLPYINEMIERQAKKFEKEIVTEVEPLINYVIAEERHQDYLVKHPNAYCHVDLSRIPDEKPNVDAVKTVTPSDAELLRILTPMQYHVMRNNGTESPFSHEYHKNYEPGLYVDRITGEPLFLSIDQYDSKSGWPSFTRPVDRRVLVYRADDSYGMNRIEVRSRIGDHHLGHVFTDGPAKEGGLRYCINGSALRFIPEYELEEQGYEDFLAYF